MQRIEVHEDAECEANFPAAFSAVVQIETFDGRSFRQFVHAPQGDPDTLPDAEQLRAKFAPLVRPCLGVDGEQRLFDTIHQLSEGIPVDLLLDAAAPQGDAASGVVAELAK